MNSENENRANWFYTRDISLTACLLMANIDFDRTTVESYHGKVSVKFAFRRTPEFENVRSQYFDNQIQVNPLVHSKQIRSLLDIIRQAKMERQKVEGDAKD